MYNIESNAEKAHEHTRGLKRYKKDWYKGDLTFITGNLIYISSAISNLEGKGLPLIESINILEKIVANLKTNALIKKLKVILDKILSLSS